MRSFASKKNQLKLELGALQTGKMRLKKRTISNLFRYAPSNLGQSNLSLENFNSVIGIDVEKKTLDVEGLATYEGVVDFTLARGLLPLVTPELKHITVGGATVGIGIESTGFRHGFVHDGMIEAEVLLPDGRIVLCNANDSHTDLFHALPNSYGTLGYILRAKIRLLSAKRCVHIKTSAFSRLDEYLQAMRAATEDSGNDFVEGLFFSVDRFCLMTARFVDNVPHVDDIVRRNIFYKLVQLRPDVYLTTKDYIFRYDPEWFWNIPESRPYQVFRRYAPRRLRNSGFYTRYCQWERKWQKFLPSQQQDQEPLIQDWEVPWRNAGALVKYALENVDLDGKPWVAVPIKTPASPTLYPISANELYFNLGCYCQVKKVPGREDYHYTKIMDRKCFELGGIKMLYSSSFLSRDEFERLYNGPAYAQLKAKYDPRGKAYTLYEKAIRNGSQ